MLTYTMHLSDKYNKIYKMHGTCIKITLSGVLTLQEKWIADKNKQFTYLADPEPPHLELVKPQPTTKSTTCSQSPEPVLAQIDQHQALTTSKVRYKNYCLKITRQKGILVRLFSFSFFCLSPFHVITNDTVFYLYSMKVYPKVPGQCS